MDSVIYWLPLCVYKEEFTTRVISPYFCSGYQHDVCIARSYFGCFYHAGTVFVLDIIRRTTTT